MEQREKDILGWLVGRDTQSPPGRNTKQLQGEIQDFLTKNRFSVESYDLYENDPILVATLHGKNPDAPKLIVNGHVDVANVDDPKYWNTDPFELKEIDDHLYGRGVSDMKGAMAALFYLFEKFTQEGIGPEGDIIIQSVVGEESGEAGTKLAMEHTPKADFALNMDTSDLNAWGQGGCITGWITVESDTTYHDGVRSHMRQAGGGLNGASAIEKMMKVIQSLNELEQHWAVMKKSEGMPLGFNTINPAVIEGGRNAAFIADRCSLWITVHFLPEESHTEVIQEIEDHLNRMANADLWLRDHPLQFNWEGNSMIEDRNETFPSFRVPVDHPGVKMLQDAMRDVTSQELNIGMSPSVNDGGWTDFYGVPTVTFGPGKLEEAHTTNEKIKTSELETFTDVLEAFLRQWMQHPERRE